VDTCGNAEPVLLVVSGDRFQHGGIEGEFQVVGPGIVGGLDNPGEFQVLAGEYVPRKGENA
jgi:hypothetical protein